MLRYFFTCSLIILTLAARSQDSLVIVNEEFSEPAERINELGFGLLAMIPAGIYKSHDSRVQPGFAFTYFREIGSLSSLYQYLGIEVDWIDLGTAKKDITDLGPDGEFEYTSIADIEYASIILNYRLQPDLAFVVWPYVEIGIGTAAIYTNDRERFKNDDGETEENIDLVTIDWTLSKRFGFGVQYLLSNINSYLDLSWRFSFHNKIEYNTIDKKDVPPNSRPIEFIDERVSRVSTQLVKLSFNYMF